MSSNSSVVGYKKPDEKWLQMKRIYDLCVNSNVKVPEEVEDYLDENQISEEGIEIDLEKLPCTEEYREEMREGFTIYLDRLPKEIKSIRFYNSY